MDYESWTISYSNRKMTYIRWFIFDDKVIYIKWWIINYEICKWIVIRDEIIYDERWKDVTNKRDDTIILW